MADQRMDLLNSVISSTQNIAQQKGKIIANADDLVKEARDLGGDAFKIWDEVLDNDKVGGNNISENRYFANGKNLLFQSQADATNLANTVSLYDIKSQSMKKITDKSEIFNILDQMDGASNDNSITDSKGRKIAKDRFLNNSKISMKLTQDGFELVGFSEGDLGTTASGDPHYYINNQHVFDHQGIQGEEYLELDSSEMKIISNRGSYGTVDPKTGTSATVIVDESIELKGSNITVVAHQGGKYEVHQTDANGDDIILMDQSGYKTANAADILTKAGVAVNLAGSAFSVSYAGRKASLQLNNGYINDMTSTREGDSGLRSQGAGIYDQTNEKNKDGVITINGKEYYYDSNQQDLVKEGGHGSYNLDRKITVNGTTLSAREAILADLAKLDKDNKIDGWITNADGTKKRISLADAFNASNGYSATEFDELIGQLIYSADSKYF